MLTAALAIAALLIGLTGAWSPCGLSMVETIGPTGHTGGRRTTVAALASFVPGAILGGVATFGALAVAGDLVFGSGVRGAYVFAGAIALLGALAEARGLRIVPQIRRQVPEHWRRIMPLPLAACLYGILLGLGFTTFVLSFGVWALAGISFALGDPAAGVAIGVSFGGGRALPVLLLAPICDRPLGIRVTEMMTQRPAIYRGFRAGDALALAVVAAATATALPAGAAVRSVSGAGEPSAAGRDLAYQRVGGGGVLRRGGSSVRLPGGAPAVGGPFIAVRRRGNVVLLDRRQLTERGHFTAPGVDGLAVSGSWLAYRARRHGHDVIRARRIFHRGIGAGHAVGAGGAANPEARREIREAPERAGQRSAKPASGIAFGPDRVVTRSRRSGGLSRPGLFRGTLVYSSSSRHRSAIIQRLLGGHRRRVLVRSRRWLLSDPSIWGRSLAYVRATNERQQLRVRRRAHRGKGRVVFTLPATSFRDRDHDPGHGRLHTRIPKPDLRRSNWNLIATAIAPGRVYATLLREGTGTVRARIIRTGR